jgi:alkaline phosphatase D
MAALIKTALQSEIGRRSLLGGLGIALAAPGLIGRACGQSHVWSKGDPFSLGVASGNPAPDRFVIWTRLAPEPLSADPSMPGGMANELVSVRYEIATDPAMRDVVVEGTAIAEPMFAHSVHVDVVGLAPGRPYWYRFTCGEAASRIGRALTAPSPGSSLDRFRLAFVSCSNYEHGYFSAYRHLADEQPDVVLFLGDYIYEYIDKRSRTVRKHSDGVEAATLPTYRNRYTQYRLDPDLQRLHAEIPALMTWDDHEVQNDYADQWSQTFDDPKVFLQRRAAAYQAFYEHMPVRASLSRPNGPIMRIYDRLTFGDLVEVSMIDGRQYRSREACYGPPKKGGGHLESNISCPERLAPQRSMLGIAQEAWLFDSLARSQARWNIVAQDVLMAQLRQTMDDGAIGFWTDDWDGYPANRSRILQHLHDSKTSNPVIFGGDLHSFWANDLKLDFDNPTSPVVATEFLGTSISAHGPPYEKFVRYLPDNPHVRFFDSRVRGYASAEITPKAMTTRFQTVSDATDPNATISTLRSFTVEDRRPGVIAN